MASTMLDLRLPSRPQHHKKAILLSITLINIHATWWWIRSHFLMIFAVFWSAAFKIMYKLHFCYRQHCAQRKPPVFNLLRGRFWGFSPRRGYTLHRWEWNLARRWGPKVPSPPPCQISLPSVQRQWCRTPKTEICYSDLTKMWNINASQGRIPCAIFTKLAEFLPHFKTR